MHAFRRVGTEEFADLYKGAARWRQVSPQIKSMLGAVYVEIRRRPADLRALSASLDHLLSFLASAAGRTDANCSVVDAFFAKFEQSDPWAHLPANICELLSDMGGTLHDTVHAPHVARSFESLPEQLLERLRNTT